MKTFKLPLLLAAIVMACLGAFAFKAEPKTAKFSQWYVLSPGGTLLDRNDWVPAGMDPGCPTVHSSEVCGIYADDDNGIPSEASFNDITSNSVNFSQAYGTIVQFKP